MPQVFIGIENKTEEGIYSQTITMLLSRIVKLISIIILLIFKTNQTFLLKLLESQIQVTESRI